MSLDSEPNDVEWVADGSSFVADCAVPLPLRVAVPSAVFDGALRVAEVVGVMGGAGVKEEDISEVIDGVGREALRDADPSLDAVPVTDGVRLSVMSFEYVGTLGDAEDDAEAPSDEMVAEVDEDVGGDAVRVNDTSLVGVGFRLIDGDFVPEGSLRVLVTESVLDPVEDCVFVGPDDDAVCDWREGLST